MTLQTIRMYFRVQRMLQRITIGMARGLLNRDSRTIDPTNPRSWEFSGLSQNGEDGIIDFLSRKLMRPNNFFVEIGASFGTENNTTWLAAVRKYTGLLVEGDPKAMGFLHLLFTQGLELNVDTLQQVVRPDTVDEILSRCLYKDPDVFSIDIDGNDYHVIEALFKKGLRPKIVVVEFNSAFGPDEGITIPFQHRLNFLQSHETRLYYGVSITGWKNFFRRHSYKFITVESNGVNAFFVNPVEFQKDFLRRIKGTDFRENAFQLRRYPGGWKQQFEAIRDREFITI